MNLQPRTVEAQRAYYDGVRVGLRMYAWWKDGVEHVGTCGTTLEEAVVQVNRMEAAQQKLANAIAMVNQMEAAQEKKDETK